MKQHLYHISNNPYLDELTLDNFCVDSLALNEPTEPRICFAPTIEQCLFAVEWRSHVYRTKYPVYNEYAVDVADAHITDERWVWEDTRVELIAEFDYDSPIGGCEAYYARGLANDEQTRCVDRVKMGLIKESIPVRIRNEVYVIDFNPRTNKFESNLGHYGDSLTEVIESIYLKG